ncbi:MAG: hypothetical protein R2726_03145 [Acidimicrobiales bacterium]
MQAAVGDHRQRVAEQPGLAPGSIMVQAPQSTPTTDRLRSSTWLAGNDGIVPEAKPITTNRPNSRSARRAGSARSPPTMSSTTSTPSPPASSRARSLSGSEPVSMTWSAPAARAASRFSLVDAAPITVAPSAFATSTAARPTPPPAPRTSTVSPAARWARSRRANSAVQ